MAEAWIAGRATDRDAAVREAARVLARSRAPVIAGMDTDVAGAEAATALARRIDAVVDHAASAAFLGLRDAMASTPAVLTTPLQARARADLVLLVGPGLGTAWPGIWKHLRLDAAPSLLPEQARRVLCLCPGADVPPPAAAEKVGTDAGELMSILAVLRAMVAGHRTGSGAPLQQALAGFATALAKAHFAVAIWSPAELDPLATEMLLGLIDDCNATTRCAGLPLALPAHGDTVAQACTWSTGFPTRLKFANGVAAHEPWRFDATRLVESAEADVVIWIGAHAPPWRRNLPSIVLAPSDAPFGTTPDIRFAVGVPGKDHGGVMFAPELGALAFRAASAPSEAAPVSAILQRIAAALP